MVFVAFIAKVDMTMLRPLKIPDPFRVSIFPLAFTFLQLKIGKKPSTFLHFLIKGEHSM